MEAVIEDISNRAIIALEANLANFSRSGVTADWWVSEITEHPLVVTAQEVVAVLLVGRALAINVESRQVENSEYEKDPLEELQQLHVADNAVAKHGHWLPLQ